MGPWTKFVIGGLATILLGWLTYNLVCGPDDAGTPSGDTGSKAASGTSETTVPATAERARACQSDIDSLMASKAIQFRSGSAYISPASVSDLAEQLKKCAGTKVEVQGHTDLSGPATTNQIMSQARADAVVAELVKQGVPDSQLTAKGYGSSQPLINARTRDANIKNRRTVLKVTTTATNPGGQ